MVKRQKEKQYLSAKEQREQGRSRSNPNAFSSATSGIVQKFLPFKCCALTLVAFETPVCIIVDGPKTTGTTNSNQKYGVVFENTSLMEFVLKHKKDPVVGNPMNSSKIIRLNMDRDSETGDWQCPVLTKAFSDHTTKIVAVISPSGGNEANVYSYEAYHELNVKPKNYVDLTTGLKFSPKKDVIVLNDPSNPTFQKNVRDVSTFWHVRNARKNNSSSCSSNIRKSVTATRVMEQVQKERKAREEQERKKAAAAAKQKAAAAANAAANQDGNIPFSHEIPGGNLPFRVPTEDVTGVKYSSGATAGGLTSTAGGTGEDNLRAATPEEILESRFRVMTSKANKGKKGYVRLLVQIQRQQQQQHPHQRQISSGADATPIVVPLLLELHCDIVPRTCSNFLGLCRKKRYNGTIFHRWIADFMIQGGGEKGKQQCIGKNKDDDGNNKNNKSSSSGDACLWGLEGFRDEFDDRLKHTGEGILAMANAGPNTNKQQFYVTLGSNPCPHLDRKHSVFGAVVKGLDEFRTALDTNVQKDSRDRPFLERLDLRTGETTTSHAVVMILATEILEDPSKQALEQEDQRLTELHDARQQATADRKRKRMVGGGSNSGNKDKKSLNGSSKGSSSLGVGKYLKVFQGNYNDSNGNSNTNSDGPASTDNFSAAAGADSTPTALSFLDAGLPELGPGAAAVSAKKKKAKTKFGDFGSW
uniref:PPIase cyclophilin-type domain-containing protein n=1 Tax=Pseudo-nitzschia australis TaxID=44445 RepID=A0A7S4AFB4_9STRA|mmetsp:Transcript_24629/g.53976  ORF Transcript_24629/g.53976 Transcript_24629/m.53976 type:complete len:700 (+) Transcript_24629:311-2410(+)|eukprot:CAMPEP_0168192858 /NCGR_PEP_ID=MMETSP0139_2-20121125/18275_1 /TAXON_ID=44445 /ORGANISM="Pseudo-nitzschia australis, Strain 10249 10 AB" /LENGTH=699 /DNA_ID=CAMNT_0008116131 /DNA_START=183 /DNA_END=2282 /DNA_ORIENTATION=-